MIVLIDNYDSFAHNLARYFGRLGQTVHVVRNDRIDVAGVRALRPSAVVLSPGPCTPREAGISLDIVRGLHAEIPILGVCLGHQAIAEVLGATIKRARAAVHGQASAITHTRNRLFSGLPSPLNVARYHSLVVEADDLPSVLQPTAWTADGVLMAFEHVNFPVYGVQFHPESILTECGYELLANFLQLSGISVPPDYPQRLGATELHRSSAPLATLPAGPVTF